MKTNLLRQLRWQYAADCEMMQRSLLVAFIILLCSFIGEAQTAQDSACFQVHLIDAQNNEDIPFANIVAYQNGVQVGVGTTDMDGNCHIGYLAAGKYDLKGVYVGYQASELKGVIAETRKVVDVTIKLKNGEGVLLCGGCCCCHCF